MLVNDYEIFLYGGFDKMDLEKIKSRIVWSSFFLFACLNGGTGAVLYYHQEFLNRWEGWVLAAAPMGVWLIFAMVVQGLVKETPPGETEPEGEGAGKEAAERAEEAAPEEKTAEELYPREIAVVQLLGLLQREGRLLDFLEEDIEPYEDAQIGAAVREVHRGCKAALNDALGLRPVLDAPEGSEVEIEEDFDPTKIRLIGNIHGNPPFKGVIRHSGWRYTRIDLPRWTTREKTDVLAPAEVEVS